MGQGPAFLLAPTCPCPIYGPTGSRGLSPDSRHWEHSWASCVPPGSQSHSSGWKIKGASPAPSHGSSDLCYQSCKNSLLLAIPGHGNPQGDALF